jgi:hypothetical protein
MKVARRLAIPFTVVALAAGACADEADEGTVIDTTETTEVPETTATTEAPETTEGPSQEVYAVGDTAHTDVFDVTVNQVVDPWTSGNQFETPAAGHRFVAIEASLVNTEGDELETWSSILGAEMTDSQGRSWDVALAGMDLPQLDGDVGRNQTRRGWVVFEVANDAAGLQLRLKGSLTATGSLFQIT